MKINEIDDDKLLEEFLSRGTIEKAPEEFVLKTLTRIRIETTPERKGFLKRNRVPVISALVVSALIAAAALAPSQNTVGIFNKFSEYINLPESLFQGITDIRLHEISAPGINIPEWLPYAMAIALIFGFIDRALFRLFHRE